MHKRARFSPAELRAYYTGYQWGIIYALRIVVEAIRRFEDHAKWARAAARRKRSA